MRMAGIEDTAELLEKQLAGEMSKMTQEEAFTLARAFSHYLNLMAIAETHHSVRKARNVAGISKSCDDIFSQLIQGGISSEDLYNTVCKQEVETVLTAHPTQINRRTLQFKHVRIAQLLEQNDRHDLNDEDRDTLIEDLAREITAIWQSDELRRQKPTPVDEARCGLHIVEQSLWKSVPQYLRRVSNALKKHTERRIIAQKDYGVPGNLNKVENVKEITGLLDGSGEYTLVYEDNEGDRMLVGDDPWDMFASTVKRLRVLKSSELSALRVGSGNQGKRLL